MANHTTNCHYCTLGVFFGAEDADIKKAYHQVFFLTEQSIPREALIANNVQRARENHPDKHVAADHQRQTAAMQRVRQHSYR
jgi:hypothetical protein